MVGWNVEPHCAAEGQALMMAMPGHLLHAGRRPGEPPAAGLGLLWAGPWLLDGAGLSSCSASRRRQVWGRDGRARPDAETWFSYLLSTLGRKHRHGGRGGREIPGSLAV